MASKENDKSRQVVPDSADRVGMDTYDRGIIPAETAARAEREGDQFKKHPTQQSEAAADTDEQTDADSIDTEGGYTVDREGLVNNFAIEPEMYYEVPGDARQVEEAEDEERVEEYESINEEKDGLLTDKADNRGRGPGII